jgi:protein gp37
MAETSAISWTRSTFNPWIGCTRVSPGCDACYAAVSTPARSMAIKWGPGEQRRRTSIHNWNQPRRWNKLAPDTTFAGRKGFWPVFCSSLADVFDNEVPDEWRRDLWDLIEETPNLTWMLLTKRIGNVARLARTVGWLDRKNVWLGITVVNQEEADRDIPKLLATPASKRWISYEPALGAVNFEPYFEQYPDFNGVRVVQNHTGIDWVIVGGESDQAGAKARPFNINWAHSTIAQCKRAGVAAFVKQMGSNLVGEIDHELHDGYAPLLDRAGADPAEWPEDLRVQEFPR